MNTHARIDAIRNARKPIALILALSLIGWWWRWWKNQPPPEINTTNIVTAAPEG